jgi:hypothetical protein
MRMKKIFLVLAAALCVATVSAQSKFESSVKQAAKTVASQKWSVGLRATYGVQVVSECFYAGDKYFEGRLGIFGGACADFTVLHNWNCCNWDWTPAVGKWYLDAGVGAHIGGAAHVVTAGVVGDVKFGIKFNKVPIRLAVDYSPVIGIYGLYPAKYFGHAVGFNTSGFYNFALSATWCF